MDEVRLHDAVEPNDWFVVFHTASKSRLLSMLACGRFKHVSAFAYVPGFKAWLLYDTQWSGTRLMVLAHSAARCALAEYTRDCTIVKFARRNGPIGLGARFGFYCVPAIKHLIGLPCVALRPDALYRSILRNGGIPVGEREHAADTDGSQPRR